MQQRGGRGWLDLVGRMFGRESQSKEIAKERLRLVLVHDRASVRVGGSNLSPQFLELLRNELIQVINRYLEIDSGGMEVNLRSEGGTVALVASIPIKAMRRNLVHAE